MNRGGELAVVALAALVVVMGAARRPSSSGASGSTTPTLSAAGLTAPTSLPDGATGLVFDDLPTDGERAEGCRFVDRGFGDYGAWRPLKLPGVHATVRALVPQGARAVTTDGAFRALLHFHGAEAVRRQIAPEPFDIVVVAIDAGIGSKAYDQLLADPRTFDDLVMALEREVASAGGLPKAHLRRLVVSSWSAGYGAVARILTARPAAPAAVILLDSLYASFVGDKHTPDAARLAPFLEAARGAMAGGGPFVLTHSDIATPGYASTGQVASAVAEALGIPFEPIDAPPLRREAKRGNLWLRGYAGADRDAHCNELRRLPSILRDEVLPKVL